MTIKGTEYFEAGQHTLLTPQGFAPLQAVIGAAQRWLEDHAQLYLDGENCAPVGLLYPGEALWLAWQKLAPLYQGAGQVLTWYGIPWQVVTDKDLASASQKKLKVLLTFGSESRAGMLPPGLKEIHLPGLPGWQPGAEPFLARHPRLRRQVSRGAHFLLNMYFSSRFARRVLDGLGTSAVVLRSPVFNLPNQARCDALLAALPKDLAPRLDQDDPQLGFPILIETWRRGNQLQVHLVNYSDQPQIARIVFPAPVHARVISPDRPAEAQRSGTGIEVPVDVYTILLMDEVAAAAADASGNG